MNHAALVGRIGSDGEPFLVGAEDRFTVPAAVRLYLGVNDRGFDNNGGAFTADVRIQ